MRMLAILLLLTSCATLSEDISTWRPKYGPAITMAISGASYGVHETVVHHPDRIPDNWNKQWWDSRISWTNKGDTFLGKTIGSFGTDAKHTFGPISRWTMYGSGVWIGIGKKRPFVHYVLDAGVSFLAFSIGFHSVYTIGFR